MSLQQEIISWGEFESTCKALADKKVVAVALDAPIYIFGAGRFGRDLASALKERGFKVSGFIETTPRLKTCGDLRVH